MAHLPVELAMAPEETTVVGDIEAFIEYLESGQALRDWQARFTAMAEECDAFLREHSHVWSHIVIQGYRPDVGIRRAA